MSVERVDRRTCLLKLGAVAGGGLVAVSVGRRVDAAEHEGDTRMLGHGATDGYVMRSDVAQRCGTCEFWGGPRRLAEDGKSITITGLGWCNNPKSHNFQKMTSPEHGPMAVWKKWQLLV